MSTMPADSLTAAESETIRGIVATVLQVPIASVQPDTDLVYELGAESIDFLDLLFNLDELAGTRVLPEVWGTWIRGRLPGADQSQGITPRILEEFVLYYRTLPALATGEEVTS